MKWLIELNGEGGYWWRADSPAGTVYVDYSLSNDDRALPWRIRWYPFDEGDGMEIGAALTEDDGRLLAAKLMRKMGKDIARSWK